MKYKPVYKCSICNCSIEGTTELNESSEEIKKFCKDVLLLKDFYNNDHVPMTILHFCKDGSVGLANFAGLKAKE